mmetsp:Transcript_8830/g.19807  ORF Transcript_8830/g.19807 Transcript_8830/m.19807 type:complete len:110 (+) Transcript_8830:676-1005(+)
MADEAVVMDVAEVVVMEEVVEMEGAVVMVGVVDEVGGEVLVEMMEVKVEVELTLAPGAQPELAAEVPDVPPDAAGPMTEGDVDADAESHSASAPARTDARAHFVRGEVL